MAFGDKKNTYDNRTESAREELLYQSYFMLLQSIEEIVNYRIELIEVNDDYVHDEDYELPLIDPELVYNEAGGLFLQEGLVNGVNPDKEDSLSEEKDARLSKKRRDKIDNYIKKQTNAIKKQIRKELKQQNFTLAEIEAAKKKGGGGGQNAGQNQTKKGGEKGKKKAGKVLGQAQQYLPAPVPSPGDSTYIPPEKFPPCTGKPYRIAYSGECVTSCTKGTVPTSGNLCVCPEGRPKWSGSFCAECCDGCMFQPSTNTCVRCDGAREHWSESQRKCIECEAGETWNEDTEKCEKMESDKSIYYASLRRKLENKKKRIRY